MRAVALPALVLLALLSACGDKKSDGPERKTAAGEVLGGTISDAMLPLATVTSQSPPLRESAGSESGEAADKPGKPGEEAGGDEPAAAPAASPAPSAAASASATPQAED